MIKLRIFTIIIVLLMASSILPLTDDSYLVKHCLDQDGVNSIESKICMSQTPSTRGENRAVSLSSWNDTFDDNSKIQSEENIIIENGYVMLDSPGGTYYDSGYIISNDIDPPYKCSWKKFHANISSSLVKRQITIDNTQNSNTLTDYAIHFTFDSKSLIDAGKMRSDCGDLRFYDINSNELHYWIESGINTATTEVWVNVTSIAASTYTYIFMDYGNSNLQSKSSGKDTFEFFESFEDPKGYNENYWEPSSGTSDPDKIYSRSSDKVLDQQYSLKVAYTTSSDRGSLGHVESLPYNNKIQTFHFYDNTNQNPSAKIVNTQISGLTDHRVRLYTHTNEYGYQYYTGGPSWSAVDYFKTRATGWHEIKIVYSSINTTFYFDNMFVASRPVTNFVSHSIGYSVWGGILTQYYDSYFIRDHTDPEPSITIGPETIPSGINVTFKVLNASTDAEIKTITDGSDISDITEQSIKLKAEFTSNGLGSIFLYKWGIDWNTLPAVEDIKPEAPAAVYRNESIIISINITDMEEPENALVVMASYKSPYDSVFTTNFITTPAYISDHWECTFSPPKSAETGLYTFQFTITDSFPDTTTDESYQMEVLNNIPSPPSVSITPAAVDTLDSFSVSIDSSYDIETPVEDLVYWYHWYKNGTFNTEYENKTTILHTVTAKNDVWGCRVYTYDGEDAGAPGDVEVTIQNSVPVIMSLFEDLEMWEDTAKTLENKLSDVFIDHDDDSLLYSSSAQHHINIEIVQENGTVTFTPDADWHGTESITFCANDSVSEETVTVPVTVKPANDLPELLRIGSQTVSDEYPELDFMAMQDEWLNLTITATDIDGDDDRGMLMYVLNITETDRLYFDKTVPQLAFKPDNDLVGWHYLEIKVTDNNETPVEYISQKIKIYVMNVNDPPTVEITEPESGKKISENKDITFSCRADDIDFEIPDSTEKLTYRWYARVPEVLELGTGSTLENPDLPPGSYSITVEVKDASNATATDTITITVNEEAASLFSNNFFWFAGIFMIIIVIIAVAAFLFYKKSRREAKTVQAVVTKPTHTQISPYTGMQVSQPPQHAELTYAASPAPQLPSVAPAQPPPSTAGQQPADIDTTLTLAEKLKLLEERFLRGEIDQDIYENLKAKFEMEARIHEPSAVPTPQLPQGMPQVTAEPTASETPVQESLTEPSPEVQQAQPTPVTQVVQQNVCTTCGGALSYFQEYNSYYCYNCQKYI